MCARKAAAAKRSPFSPIAAAPRFALPVDVQAGIKTTPHRCCARAAAACCNRLPPPRLPALCAGRLRAAEARAAARRQRQGRPDRGRDLGAARRGLRPLRRRGAATAKHRHAYAGRRPERERLSGRGRGGRRRARHYELRRLARLPLAGKSAGLGQVWF